LITAILGGPVTARAEPSIQKTFNSIEFTLRAATGVLDRSVLQVEAMARSVIITPGLQ